jgi:8-oxo-dGTP pyrophosphatase MutT (NUDIX family)
VSDEIRRAASVVAVREGAPGPEVLVLERSASSRFLASYVVFPGGSIDRDDTELAGRWFGDAAHAARAAAVRELVEETGLALTSAGVVDVARRQARLEPVDAAPPSTGQLPELCHWVAPVEVPVRFDATYYVITAARDLEPSPDGIEAARAWWASPTELLACWEAGDHKLYWPTWFTVRRLADCGSADEVAALSFETREPDDEELERMPRSVFWEG